MKLFKFKAPAFFWAILLMGSFTLIWTACGSGAQSDQAQEEQTEKVKSDHPEGEEHPGSAEHPGEEAHMEADSLKKEEHPKEEGEHPK